MEIKIFLDNEQIEYTDMFENKINQYMDQLRDSLPTLVSGQNITDLINQYTNGNI
jgi:hypothetical protein